MGFKTFKTRSENFYKLWDSRYISYKSFQHIFFRENGGRGGRGGEGGMKNTKLSFYEIYFYDLEFLQ